MARPKKYRNVNCKLEAYYFKPRGIPIRNLETVLIHKDELEAVRLADYLLLSHEEAAEKMEISRATFGRIVKLARKRIAESILFGKAIEIIK